MQLLQRLLQTLLPVGTPALGSLVHLGLVQLGLVDLPEDFMQCLHQLKDLDLTSNNFSKLPAALKDVPSLEILSMASNIKLQFQSSDVCLLAALPRLKVLQLGSGGDPIRWTEKTAEEFLKISKLLPNLELLMAGRKHESEVGWNMWS